MSIGSPKYVNGKIDEFGVDPDKICYLDLVGDIQVLGYDINKTINLFHVNGDGTLNQIYDDSGVVGLSKQLRILQQ